MKIATVLNIHNDENLVKDTVESILKYVSKDVLCVVDATAAAWAEELDIGVPIHRGFHHNYPKSPYRNVALALNSVSTLYDADWYCVTEPDVLFTSSNFKPDLEERAKLGFWCVGNDHRIGSGDGKHHKAIHLQQSRITENYKLPHIEKTFNLEFLQSEYLLGCCVFYHRDFINKLKEINFFNKFLTLVNCFPRGEYPDFKGYDISEHLYPTLARALGGRVGGLAHYDATQQRWLGKFDKYPMRWRPDLDVTECFENACIMHPIKDYLHPIREYHRKKRSEIV
jgi:hypothetical protein